MADEQYGLLNYDPAIFRQIMSQFEPTEDERKRARLEAILASGLALMGTQKGREMEGIGRAGLLGLGAYNQGLRDIGETKRGALESASKALTLQEAMKKIADDRGLREIYSRMPVGAQQTAAAGMPSLAPTIANAETLTQRQAAAPQEDEYERLMRQSRLLTEEGIKKNNLSAIKMGQEYAEKALKFRDENQGFETVMQDGKPIVVQRRKYGAPAVIPGVLPKPDYKEVGTGQEKFFYDPLSGQRAGGFQMQMTPGEVASNRIAQGNLGVAQANLGVSRERLDLERQAGQIVETPQGYARIGKDNTVTPIVAGGGQLQPKPTGAVTQQIAQNNVTLDKIARAAALVDQAPFAFGLKNFAGDAAMQRLNPSGVEARAMVADIAGQKIHDRSGAAVTVGEAERLRPYVPNVTDTADVVKKKLALFDREYRAMQAELMTGRSIGDVAGGAWSIREVK